MKKEFEKKPGQYAPFLREPPPTFSFWQDIGFALSFLGAMLFPVALLAGLIALICTYL